MFPLLLWLLARSPSRPRCAVRQSVMFSPHFSSYINRRTAQWYGIIIRPKQFEAGKKTEHKSWKEIFFAQFKESWRWYRIDNAIHHWLSPDVISHLPPWISCDAWWGWGRRVAEPEVASMVNHWRPEVEDRTPIPSEMMWTRVTEDYCHRVSHMFNFSVSLCPRLLDTLKIISTFS